MLVAVAVAGTGMSVAAAAGAFTDSSGQIHACVVSASGAVRIVRPAAACRTGEESLAWNQQGPAGSAGGAVRTLVSFADSTRYSEPTNVVSQGPSQPLDVGPGSSFTLSSAGFVQVLAHARLTSTDEWGGYGTCDGAPGNGPRLDAVIDGSLQGATFGELNPQQGTGDRAGEGSFWLAAGSHEIRFQFTPNGCTTSGDGTTHVDQLAMTVVGYP